MVEEYKDKTVFHTKFGLYYCGVMPVDTCNAPAMFQLMINNIFYDLLNNRVIVYLDIIWIYTENVDKHGPLVGEVLF